MLRSWKKAECETLLMLAVKEGGFSEMAPTSKISEISESVDLKTCIETILSLF